MSELINGRTPEEIKRVLEWATCACGNLVCEECQYYGSVCSSENFERIAPDALALIERLESERDAALAKVPKWISVEERLPEDRKPVNVMFGDGFSTLGFLQDTKWYVAGFLYEQFGIKYWSSLPEPPERD